MSRGSERTTRNAGRWVVLGMFLFAAALTATDWIYWKYHVGPFLPLQQKLAGEYPGSRPHVEGGQRRIHKETPKILRITMKVDFDPTTEAGKPRAGNFARRVAAFVAGAYPELADYELLELHFYWPEPEKEIKQAAIRYEVAALRK